MYYTETAKFDSAWRMTRTHRRDREAVVFSWSSSRIFKALLISLRWPLTAPGIRSMGCEPLAICFGLSRSWALISTQCMNRSRDVVHGCKTQIRSALMKMHPLTIGFYRRDVGKPILQTRATHLLSGNLDMQWPELDAQNFTATSPAAETERISLERLDQLSQFWFSTKGPRRERLTNDGEFDNPLANSFLPALVSVLERRRSNSKPKLKRWCF